MVRIHYDMDESNPAGYRPISNLNTIVERLCAWFGPAKISYSDSFNQLQAAYRQLHSTETALLKIMISEAADTGQTTPLVAPDVSTAFDMVDRPFYAHRPAEFYS